MDCSPLGSSVHEIFQVRILEEVTMLSSRASSWPRDQTCVSYICLLGGGFLFTSSIFRSLCESHSAEITQREVNRVNNEKANVAHLYPTLCDPPDYTVHGIFQGRIPEWVAFPFFRASSQLRDQTQVSQIRQILHQLSHKGSPSILGWVVYHFSNRLPVPGVESYTVGWFFTNWANSSAK